MPKKRDNRYLYRNNNNLLEEDPVLPTTVEEVVNLIDKTFPLFNATIDMSSDEIRFKSGQRSVAEWLNNLLKESKDNVYIR